MDDLTRPGFVPDPGYGHLIVLPRGSRLRLDWVEHKETIESSYIFMRASSADGRFKGEVLLDELCEPEELLVTDVFRQPKPYHITLQPDWLEVVKPDNSTR